MEGLDKAGSKIGGYVVRISLCLPWCGRQSVGIRKGTGMPIVQAVEEREKDLSEREE